MTRRFRLSAAWFERGYIEFSVRDPADGYVGDAIIAKLKRLGYQACRPSRDTITVRPHGLPHWHQLPFREVTPCRL